MNILKNNIVKNRYNRFGNIFNETYTKEEPFDTLDFNNSLKSINVDNLYFTNFFTSNITIKYNNYRELYKKYLNNINIFNDLLAGDEINNTNQNMLERLCDILSIANNNEKITIFDLVKNIRKYKLKKDNEMQLYIKKEDSNLYVYLIDIYHLAIPAINKKTGKNDYKKIYEKRKKANCCLSEILAEEL